MIKTVSETVVMYTYLSLLKLDKYDFHVDLSVWPYYLSQKHQLGNHN